MSRSKEQAGTFRLLARLPQQLVALVKVEIDNAKREIGAKAKRLGAGALVVVVALFFLFFSICAFVAAAIAGLATVWPVWLSALTVAVGLLLLTAGSVLLGIALIKRGIPVPDKTIDRVEGDLQAMGDVGFNASAHAQRSDYDAMPQAGEKGNWR